jgi:hypothetical protein
VTDFVALDDSPGHQLVDVEGSWHGSQSCNAPAAVSCIVGDD